MGVDIYLDNGGTTKVDERVVKAMLPFFTEQYGNASSTHARGYDAQKVLNKSRDTIAKSINALDEEIIFTSGGTESNNFILKGIAFTNKKKGNHIITTKVEHKCIMNTCAWLETQGFIITYLDVNKEGFIDPQQLEEAITNKTILVSIIHGNNETGSINDLEALGAVCKKHNVYFHTDACQSYTKTPLDVKKQHIDLMTINAHKINGPKGVGAAFIRKGINITPLLHGGDQEFKKRAGTENIPGIVGFAKAVDIASEKNVKQMTILRDKLIEGLLTIQGTKLNGPLGERRLCNNVSVSFKAIEGEAITGMLDLKGIAASTGSACSAKTLEPSYVLMAMGLTHEEANGTVRLTISKDTTEKDVTIFLKEIKLVVDKLRAISPFKGDA